MSTTSGRRSAAMRRAVRRSAAISVTSKSGCRERRACRPSATARWSSTMRMRILLGSDATRSLYARDILGPRAIFGTVAQRATLSLRRAPHRTGEREVGLTHDLGTFACHDPDAAQREIQVAQREPRDVRETAVVRLDHPSSRALDRVGAGLVQR